MKTRVLSLICAACLLLGALPSAAALSGEERRAADTLHTLGLLDQESADLSAPATRGDGVTLLVALAGVESAAAADTWISGFRDVPAALHSAVNYASHQNWVSGTTVLTFSPDAPLSANAWYAFLLRMLGYSEKSGDFSVSDAALFARRIGLAAQTYSGSLTRGQLYTAALEALPFPYKDGSATVAERLLERGAVSRSALNALGLTDRELTAREAADRCMAAVFQMSLYSKSIEVHAGVPSANASGFFITPDGLAVTNCHSLEGSMAAEVVTASGEVYPVERVLFFDREIDAAVIRVSRTSREGRTTSAFAALELADPADVRAGDTIYALGSPLGLGLAVSAGVVSDPARMTNSFSLPCIMNTADISKGSSGGALLNVYGQVVGITSGSYVLGNNMYLAVPVEAILSTELDDTGWSVEEVRDLLDERK